MRLFYDRGTTDKVTKNLKSTVVSIPLKIRSLSPLNNEHQKHQELMKYPCSCGISYFGESGILAHTPEGAHTYGRGIQINTYFHGTMEIVSSISTLTPSNTTFCNIIVLLNLKS